MSGWNAVGLAAYRRERQLVHLQYVGEMPGVPAGTLEVGDRLMWNGGAVYVVTSVREASPKFVEIRERSEREPERGEYTRRMRKDRLVVSVKAGEKFRRPARDPRTPAEVAAQWLTDGAR